MKVLILSLFLFITLTAGVNQIRNAHEKLRLRLRGHRPHPQFDGCFEGVYEGDVNLLSSAFYMSTLLFGDAAFKPYFKTLAHNIAVIEKK